MMNRFFSRAVVFFALLLFLAAPAFAELRLASPFTSHMVLQRDMPLPVWGWTTAGDTVEVRFAGQAKSTTAAADGRWRVTLDALAGSAESRSLLVQVQGADTSITLEDVVVGDVWLCSGQSNMQMSYGGIPDIKALAAKAAGIRSFAVKRSVAFTEQDELEGSWALAPPNTAVGLSFAWHLKQAVDVPVGIVHASWGSSSIEAWMPRDLEETLPHLKTIMAEFDADTAAHKRIKAALAAGKWSGKDDIFLRRQNCIVYNAMIKPLAPFAMRGLVWYQGERNTRFITGMPDSPQYMRVAGVREYDEALIAFIERYRQEWQQEHFHALLVMLPGFGSVLPSGAKGDAESPDVHSWAWMRESQMAALGLADTAVANTIDLGDVKNIHPRDKLPIGQRLALLARRDTLGEDLLAQGPTLKSVDVEAGSLRVHFEHATGLKTLDGAAPSGFWIAEKAAGWVRADARIDDETVLLSSAELKAPRFVRYAFAGKPAVNLVNAAELPAYPFRSDRFEP